MQRSSNGDDARKGLGSIALNMIGLWLGPNIDIDNDELPRRIGPLVLVLWTLFGVALGAIFSALRIAAGGDDASPVRFTVLGPMFLPLLLALIRLPGRRAPAFALAVLSGGVVGVLGAVSLSAVLGGFWAVYVSVSAGALVASAVYGAVAGAPLAQD